MVVIGVLTFVSKETKRETNTSYKKLIKKMKIVERKINKKTNMQLPSMRKKRNDQRRGEK